MLLSIKQGDVHPSEGSDCLPHKTLDFVGATWGCQSDVKSPIQQDNPPVCVQSPPLGSGGPGTVLPASGGRNGTQ
jgi:hypothetical protein